MDIFGHNIPPIYGYGVLGSLGVELAAALATAGNNGGAFPEKYHSMYFLFWRGVFAFMAGSVPLALDAQNMWSAIYLGASAPLIFDRAARGLDSDNSSHAKQPSANTPSNSG
jgi:hypothetical protein